MLVLLRPAPRMSLRLFIKSNVELIVDECEAFAKTQLPAALDMDSSALRDHAAQILDAIWRDLGKPQSATEQREKSLGHAPVDIDAAETAAEIHGTLRA